STDSADVIFFDDMLAQLTSQLCIDENRIFATGHSSGGFFTNNLACARGDVLRGIAPVSGGGPWGRGGCAGQVAAWVIHGTNDETVDVSMGEGSRDHWAEANGCDLQSSSEVSPDGCVAYAGCDSEYPVVWCTYDDGHNWPAVAPQGMWDFFSTL
ncbi:MAG: hypothetical protein JXX14_09175, partial [Deltaproteobacteria bacterium]|nr:hypothetical protein [Deltaproteobacteria bacterium]